MTSEGDSPRVPTRFFGMHWLDEERGTFPVNWGVNPVFAEQAPAMMKYFYETPSPNDYFFGGVGGAGYVFLDGVRDIELFAEHARRYLSMADIRVTDHWPKAGGGPAAERPRAVRPGVCGPAADPVLPGDCRGAGRRPLRTNDSRRHDGSCGETLGREGIEVRSRVSPVESGTAPTAEGNDDESGTHLIVSSLSPLCSNGGRSHD
jgi:hypothetical protein